jgi:hypothetical protein
MSRKVNGIGEDTIFISAAVIGVYFIVVKPLIATFGANDADKNTVAETGTTTPVQNPFSSQYQPFQNQWSIVWAATGEAPFFQNLKALYDSGQTANATDKLSVVANAAEAIWGASHWYGTAFADIMAVFNQLSSQVQVAAISDYLGVNYGKDLYTLLNNGTGISLTGLSNTNLATIINKVNSLPAQ